MDHHDPHDDSPRIVQPCNRPWEELVGDSARRYCSECRLHVLDSRRITRAEALRIVDESVGRVCMVVAYDRDGRSIHVDDERPRPETRTEATNPRWLAWSSAALLAACQQEPNAVPAPVAPPAVPAIESSIAGEEPPLLEPVAANADTRAEIDAQSVHADLPTTFVREPVPVCTASDESVVTMGRVSVVTAGVIAPRSSDEKRDGDEAEPRRAEPR